MNETQSNPEPAKTEVDNNSGAARTSVNQEARGRIALEQIFCYVMLAAAAVTLAWLLPTFSQRWSAGIAYPYQMDREEGFVMGQALTLAAGGSIYKPIDAAPWLVGNYTPLFPWLLGRINGPMVRGDSMALGRTLTLLGTLLAALLLTLIVMGRTRRMMLALVAPLLFLITFEVYQWSPYVRVDLPALALTLGGLAVFLNASRRWGLVASALLFVAAAYTKQTALLAPLACALALALHDRRGLVWFAGTGLAVGLGAFFVLQTETGGEFFRHTVTYNRNRMDWVGWQRLMVNEILFFYRWLFAAMIVAGLALWAVSRGGRVEGALNGSDEKSGAPGFGRFREWPHARHAVGIYALLATCSLLEYAKVGASPNYVLEPLAAWALWLMESLGRLLDRVPPRVALTLEALPGDITASKHSRGRLCHRLAGAAALCVSGLVLAHGVRINFNRVHGYRVVFVSPSPLDPKGWLPGATAITQTLREAPGDVFCEEPIYTLLAGKKLFWESFIMTQLVRDGRASDAPFVAMLREKKLGVVIVCDDLDGAGADDAYHGNYTPEVIAELRGGYKCVADIPEVFENPPQRKHFFVWLPKT